MTTTPVSPAAHADYFRRNPTLARSSAHADGQAAAERDLMGCATMDDVERLRGVAYGNLADGSPLERAYFTGYDHRLALAVGAAR